MFLYVQDVQIAWAKWEFEVSEVNDEKLLELTADIVAAHVSNNSVATSDLPLLIQNVHAALAAPLAPSGAAVKKDHIVCLECGKKCKTLRRHIATAHGLEVSDYVARWNLPKDYPMVASEYSERRAEMARTIGLGRKGRVGKVQAKAVKK